ncbi:MAG: porin family protein [Flavobacteriaceae bacterium]|nr:porin family protein [Flavobacteriaceae bacterium]
MKLLKGNIIIAVVFMFIASSAVAQLEITPQAGYQIGSKYSYNGGFIKLADSEQFGVTIDFDINDMGGQIEVMYAYQNAELRVKDYFFYPFETFITDVTAHHVQFGFIQNFNEQEALRPFAGLSAGFTIFDPSDSLYETRTKFTFGLTGGVKYFFTDRIGIRIQAQLLMPIEWGGVYFTNGGGVITTGGTLVQLNFTGGLIFRLGE